MGRSTRRGTRGKSCWLWKVERTAAAPRGTFSGSVFNQSRASETHVAAHVAHDGSTSDDDIVACTLQRHVQPRRSARLTARHSTDPDGETKQEPDSGECEGNSTTSGANSERTRSSRRRVTTPLVSSTARLAGEDDRVESAMGVIRKATASRGSDGGTKYHCDVCSIDITSTVRINCADADCRDYDLCVPCFSRGEKSKNHNPQTHAYRVVEQNSIPIYTDDWGADEELLMLEGSERYGLGSWTDVAEHIGGYREKDEVRDHYIDTYIHSPLFPLPELADPKNTELSERVPKEEFQARKKRRIEERQEAAKSAPPATPKQKPTASVPACHEVQGFMPGRLEFETEHLNDAEEAVQHMTFEPGDGIDSTTGEMDEETVLKMTVFDIYNSKLVARAERKKIIFEHQLLEYKKNQALSKRRTKEENDLLLKAKPFAKMMNHDDFEAFSKDLLQEHNLRQAITQLQDWRMHGVTDLKQGDKYEIEKAARAARMQPQGQFDRLAQYNPKRKEKAEENVPSEASKLVAPDLPLRFQRKPKTAPVFADSQPAVENEFDKMFAEANSNDTNLAPKPKMRYVVQPLNGVTPWRLEDDKSLAPDLQLLSEEETQLCNALHIRPKPYLALKEGLLREAMKQGGTMKKKEARGVCRIDVNKANRIFDFMIHSGWITKA